MWSFLKPRLTKQQIEVEIQEMVDAYHNQWSHWSSGFLVGSSLVGNKQGDSARYWQLKGMLNKINGM